MTEEDAQNALKTASAEVHAAASRRFVQWVFIGTYEHEDDSKQTISNWGGDLNGAIGLSLRISERMRQEIISTDFPPDEPEGGEWRQS